MTAGFRAAEQQVEAVDAGLISAGGLTTCLHLLDEPEVTFAMPLLVSAWGRR